MLKADLHVHAKEDSSDLLSYSAREVIDKAVELGIDVVSFTFHNQLFYDEIREYAESKGILLIPGIEKDIEGRHVLLYNFSPEELSRIAHFEDLAKLKCRSNLVLAPHPFYKSGVCLGSKLKKYIGLFDGIELSFLYSRFLNFNRRALKIAEKFNKVVVATSDLHTFGRFGSNYTLIDSEKNVLSVIDAVKKGRVKAFANPLSARRMAEAVFQCVASHFAGGRK